MGQRRHSMGIVQQHAGGSPKVAKSDREDAHERAVPVAVFIGQRFLLQDTTGDPGEFLQDEEIEYLLTQEVNVYTASAMGAMLLAGRSHNVKTKKVGDLSITFGSEMWKDLADWLRGRGYGYRIPTAGGISRDDKRTLEDDSDWLVPDFFRDVHRHPQALKPQRVPNLNERQIG